jgi:signal peptidase II
MNSPKDEKLHSKPAFNPDQTGAPSSVTNSSAATVWTPDKIMLAVALGVLALDQFTKFIVLQFLGFRQEHVVIEGFFRFVHWGNTGAAWSMFEGNNGLLAVISAVALVALFYFRNNFDPGTLLGRTGLGLLFGGIMGNLIDRLHPGRGHVIDFIYFYANRRGGGEIGFPAFNVADSAICIGVAILFYLSWTQDQSQTRTSG